MSDISQETHQALLQKAVSDATSATETALAAKIEENQSLATKVEELETENASLKADNDRLNGDLDKAQVELNGAKEKVAELEGEIASRDEKAAKAEIASKRAEQVKELKLYDDKYVAERASAWAEMTDEAWAERLDEWSKLQPVKTATQSSDSASAMSGTSGNLTEDGQEGGESGTDHAKESTVPARRAVLGLH